MLLYSLSILFVSILVMWYQMRAVVMNPALRPAVINTSGRMALFGITRLLTTALGVIGVGYSTGWLVAVLTYIATDVVRAVLRKRYTEASIRALTNDLVRWQQDEDMAGTVHLDPIEYLNIAREAATETVQRWERNED
jgi:hypothetical protein